MNHLAERILGVSITVPDLDAAETFYRNALGFSVVSRRQRRGSGLAETLGVPATQITATVLALGAQRLELLAFDPPGKPYPMGSTSTDLWFQHCAIVVDDVAAAVAHLQGFAVRPITAGSPVTLPENTGGVTAYKFRDPLGHPLELLFFPDGVGDPMWRRTQGQPLFRGIDHTALSVGDIDRSRSFYEQALGLRVSGSSRNRGTAQEQLDALAGDVVDVLALSPPQAPAHLELLCYHAGTRRPIPATMKASDIGATRTLWTPQAGAPTSDGTAMMRDPDGHWLVCSEHE